MEKEKIKFKPLHEGMGFHPFSDGLPYAPESKAKYQNGAGATVAGRPQFATSIPVQPKTAIKTARQLQEQKPAMTAQLNHTQINPQMSVQMNTQMTAQKIAAQIISSTRPQTGREPKSLP